MRKICFSSVLKQRSGQAMIQTPISEQSLHQMVEEFVQYPSEEFVLRFAIQSNMTSVCSKNGFQQGCNPLDQWISQQIQNNKENMADTQQRRKIPNQLMKFVKNVNAKQPQTNIQRNVQGNINNQKTFDMRQLCRQYAENKKKGSQVDAPVWKFSSKQSNHEGSYENNYQENNYNDRELFEAQIRESIAAQKFKQQQELNEKENQILGQQFSRIKNEKITTAIKTLPQDQKPKALSTFIQEIKNNLALEIQAMAQRIIRDRREEEEEEQLLISQGQERDIQRDTQRDIERQQKFSREQNFSSNQRDSRDQKDQGEGGNDQRRFEQARKYIGEYLNMRPNSHEREQVHLDKKGSNKSDERIVSFENQDKCDEGQAVGYSFASDFNQPPHENKEQTREDKQKQASTHLNLPGSQISLPNIDEVKSEQEGLQKIRDDFIEDSNTVGNKKSQNCQSIDKNYIKEIESVAYNGDNQRGNSCQQNRYTDNSNFMAPSHNYEKVYTNERVQTVEQKKQTPQKNEKRASLLEQINKTAKSIDDEQDVNQVNISVAEGVQNEGKTDLVPETKRNSLVNGNASIKSSVKVDGFVLPAPTAPKIEFKKLPSPDRHFDEIPRAQETGNVGVFMKSDIATGSQSNVPVYIAQNTVPSVTPSTFVKNSFSNILESQGHKAIEPLGENRTLLNSNNIVNNLNSSIPRVNEDTRKIKITLSPKYNDIEKNDYVTITDLKQKTEDGQTRVQYHTVTMTQSKQGKFKLNSVFPTSNDINVPLKQSLRDKENAMIKMSRYEKTQFHAQVTQSIRSNGIKRSQQFQFDLDF